MNIVNILKPFQIFQVFIFMKEKPYECIQCVEAFTHFYDHHPHDSSHTVEKNLSVVSVVEPFWFEVLSYPTQL